MPSKRKSRASRANGAKSKGPVTPEGKARSSRNALKHGLNSEIVVLPHEDRAAFEDLRDSYMERFQPAGQPEADLVETMASARWRLNRLVAIESRLFEKEMVLHDAEISGQFKEIDGEGKLACVFDRCANEGKALNMLLRYEGQLNRTYDRAFRQLQVLQKSKPPAPPKELQNEPEPNPASSGSSAGSSGLQAGGGADSAQSGDSGTSQPHAGPHSAAHPHVTESKVAGSRLGVY
jgi:hypothetical protein